MYGENKKKRTQPHFATQFSVANIASGCVVTFNDDGANKKTGEPGQSRREALVKLGRVDEDKDPVFVIVEPVPAHVAAWDAVCQQKIGNGRTLADRSRSPDFETLQEKYDANKAARESEIHRAPRQQAPSVHAEAAITAANKARAAGDDKAAARMVRKPRKPRGLPTPPSATTEPASISPNE